MDPNKFYCQNEISKIIATCPPLQEYSEPSCQMTVSYNIGPITRNTNLKKIINMEKGVSLTHVGSNPNKYTNIYGTSKYIIPSSLNALQYQHKFALQENQ